MSSPEKDKPARSEKSLSTLTKKFVEMLQSEKQLDLNEVNINFVAKKLNIIILIFTSLLILLGCDTVRSQQKASHI